MGYIHPWQALIIAVIIATLYTYGGPARIVAALIILAVFVAPIGPGNQSVLEALLKYLTELLTTPPKGELIP